jgi:hypothetical protein
MVNQKKEKLIYQQRFRRTRSLYKKAIELSDLCDVDVYLVVREPRHIHVFNSDSESGWLLSDEQMVCQSWISSIASLLLTKCGGQALPPTDQIHQCRIYVLEDEESWGSAGGDAANLATVFSAVKERVELLPTEEEQSNSMAGGSKYQV